MLSEINNNYIAVARCFNFNSAAFNKQKLLEMAKQGDPKPCKDKEGYLYRAFKNYKNKGSTAYDANFINKLKKLAPHWFYAKDHFVKINKQIVLKEAKKGGNRPPLRIKLGRMLSSYTRKSSATYDPKFHALLKKIGPDWFVNKIEIANINKKVLLEMAKNKQPRPNRKSMVGRNLASYCCRDKEFARKIKVMAPHWFVNQTEKANDKKLQLIKIAKEGKPRPHEASTLGRALTTYTRKDYRGDFAFYKLIKKIRPDWFAK